MYARPCLWDWLFSVTFFTVVMLDVGSGDRDGGSHLISVITVSPTSPYLHLTLSCSYQLKTIESSLTVVSKIRDYLR